MTVQIIILNGVGSVGKTSIAKELQAIANEPFLLVSMDTFFGMVPEHLIGHPDGVVFETVEENGKPAVVIHSGPVMDRTMRGMRHAVGAMASQGNRLIVDDVILGRGEEREYRQLLASFQARFVGLFAPLEILEAREHARGDRRIGLSRWQYDRVHHGTAYDLEIDTSIATAGECARRIKTAFKI